MTRQIVCSLLLVTLLLAGPAQAVLADGMVLPPALSSTYIGVRYHHVTVTITDNHAITRVEQEFYNPGATPLSAQYLFPVPPDAILGRFEAQVDGLAQTVTRQDGAATNAALFANVAERHDPSLLQYADWESLTFALDLPAGGARTMSLEYEQVLAPVGGMLHYRYVLSTERYAVAPLESVELTVEVDSARGLGALYSPSHAIVTERLGAGRARLTWRAENVNPAEDFDLYFSPAEGGFGGGLLTGERNDQGHFAFLFAPEDLEEQADALPKDIVFILDRSGSMSGDKITQAQNALHFILEQLGEDDRFSVVGFDDRLTLFAPTLRPADRESRSAAHAFVNRLTADGSTDLEGALQTGLSILTRSESRPDAPRLIVFLTDGLPTAGVTDEALIADLVARANREVAARLHVFGVGYDVNTHLLDSLAAENAGSVTYVQPGEDLEVALSSFYTRIARPMLTDLQITFGGIAVADVYPRTLPDMFAGSSLLLSGRYSDAADEVAVTVTGMSGDTPREYHYTFDLAASAGRDFVPRLWATRRVGALLDEVRVSGETAALISEIRTLGLDYGIVTPYTTFVIAAQSEGAASSSNMSLYGDTTSLNRASGATTVQARVQNQMYQDAAQANLAVGANVQNFGARSLAQVSYQSVDLALVRQYATAETPLSNEWLAQNIQVDRQISFGSSEYFALANDPTARPYLQSGANVLFEYQGQVIQVQDPATQVTAPQGAAPESPSVADAGSSNNAPGLLANIAALFADLLRQLLR